jgi:predicted nucleic acid-binding protein
MGDRLSSFDRILTLSRGGSPEGSRALVAVQAINGFLTRIGSEVTMVMPSPEATKLARRMLDPSPEDKQVFGLGVRRLSAAEAVSVCVALELQVGLATDDKAAAGVYGTLGGHHHKWTLDLFRDAVTEGLLSESEARRGYLHLIEVERFRGIPWD